MDQPDSPHHRRLRSEVHGLAANVDIAIVDDLQHLGQRQPIIHEFALVDSHVVGFGLSAPASDINDAGYRLETPFEYPVLDGLQIGDGIARRADNAITVDLPDRARGRYLRLRAIGQRRQLGKLVDRPLLCLPISEIVGKAYLYVGEAEKGDRPHAGDMRNAGHLDFYGNGDIALDFFG